MFFSKAEHIEMVLPVKLIHSEYDFKEAGCFTLEVFGTVLEKEVFCSATYMMKDAKTYDNGVFDELYGKMRTAVGKSITVDFKVKRNKLKTFSFDIGSIAYAYGDDRLKDIELISWGINNESIEGKI